MLQVDNQTPFVTNLLVLPDERGIDTLYPMLKATLTLPDLQLAEEQVAVVQGDDYWGEPGESSLKCANEAHLTKPSTDVVLVGSAWSPSGRSVETLDVELRVGPVEKCVRVVGDRVWKHGVLNVVPSKPKPFVSMPLVWERAFGGIHRIDPDKPKIKGIPENPVGAGFRGRRSIKEIAEVDIPNLEDPKRPFAKHGDKSRPAGFGWIAPSWSPRTEYVGTYDEAWQKTRAPFLPDDFDPRFFQAASPDLITPSYLVGGEPVRVIGAHREGPLEFRLPELRPEVAVRVAGREEQPALHLETVQLEPDDDRITLTWRAQLSCDKSVLKVEVVRFTCAGVEGIEAAA